MSIILNEDRRPKSEDRRRRSEVKGQRSEQLKVTIAAGIHLFPFRTEKLSPSAPMVLQSWESR